MSEFRIILTAKEVHNCPCLRVNDKIVYDFPKLDMENSASTCGYCVSAFMPMLVAFSQGVKFSRQDGRPDLPDLRCPFADHYAVFGVEAQPRRQTLTSVMSNKGNDRDTSFIINYLNKIPLFKPLPRTSKEHIIDYLNIEKFDAKQVIIEQGAIGQYLYILLKGIVEVVNVDKGKRENLLAELRRGECFGEMSLITGEPCSATIRAKSEVSLLAIAKQDFDNIVQQYPLLNIYFNKLLAARLRSTNVQLEEELEKGMIGKLEMISLPELTQTIAMNAKTGTLVLKHENETGEIYFSKGHIMNAQFGDYFAEDAFFQLLRWTTGTFRFQLGEPEVEHVVQWDAMGLLMEGLRLLDEATMESYENS